MAKTPSLRLFHIIKGMSSAEKRYFKTMHRNELGSKFIQLFDGIDKQVTYDESSLQQTIYGSTQLDSRKFPELKGYLYEEIIKALMKYDGQGSSGKTVLQILQYVETLYRRNHLADCKYWLAKARKHAEEAEQFHQSLLIIEWEKKLAYTNADIDLLHNQLKVWMAEEEKLQAQQNHWQVYQNLFYTLYTAIRQNAMQNSDRDAAIAAIAAHPFLEDRGKANSIRATLLLERINSLLHYYRRDMERFYSTNKTLIATLEQNPKWLRDDASEYIAVLSNFAVSCGYLKRYGEMRQILEKLRQAPVNTLDDEVKKHRQYYTNYMGLCIRTGQFEEGLRVLEQHLRDSASLDAELFERHSFYFQYFYIYFGAEDYSRALDYLNLWLNLPGSVEQQDLQVLAKLLNVVVHFEMGNHQLLEALLKTTSRSLAKAQKKGSFVQLLLGALRQAIDAMGSKQERNLFQQALARYKATDMQAMDKALLRFFDFEAWLTSKAEGRKLAEIIQQR